MKIPLRRRLSPHILIVAALVSGILALGGAAEVVIFPDPNLEQAVREAIGKPTGDIQEADLLPLTELDASGRGIDDLTGIEHCTSLWRLTLSDNVIEDLTPLSGLRNLRRLFLGSNVIANLAPLAGLTSLEWLWLDSNRVQDLSCLSSLTRLTWLSAIDNTIRELTPLSALTDLGILDLGANLVSDLTPLSGLTNLVSLGLSGNQIWDIASLAALTSLRSLYLAGNPISAFSPLSGLTNLVNLILSGDGIQDLAPLSALTNLEQLDLNACRVSDLTPLAGLARLEWLVVSGNPLSHDGLGPLAGLVELKTLFAGSCGLTEITALAGLVNLGFLVLDDNSITDIQPLVDDPGLGERDFVSLWLNLLCLDAGGPDLAAIQALRDRGADVSYWPQKPVVDLLVQGARIAFFPNPAGAGSPVEIWFVVRNLGPEDATNVLVRVFDGDPLSGGQLIGAATLPVVPAASEVSASVVWSSAHASTVYVWADPLDAIGEASETNNTGSAALSATTSPGGSSGGGLGNLPPIPSAGPDAETCVGKRVSLDGSGSYDQDGPYRLPGSGGQASYDTTLTYKWAFLALYSVDGVPVLAIPKGSKAPLTATGFDTPYASFVPDIPGEYTLLLTVTDPAGAALSDSVTITASICPPEPIPDGVPLIVHNLVARPNPSSGLAEITFDGEGVPDAFAVTIYDLSGHIVWADWAQGTGSIFWNGETADGSEEAARGVYIYVVVMTQGTTVFSDRAVLLRD